MNCLPGRGGRTATVLLFFLLLTVLLTYPMMAYFGTAIPGPPWDGFYYLTVLRWFKMALFERHVSPWFNPDICYPFGYNLALSESTLGNLALGMPVNLLAGEVVAFNSLMWLSFILSGLGTYLWAYQFTHKRILGLISGVAFAFSAYRMQAMSSGWLPVIGTQWVPFAFLYMERTLRKKQWRDAGLAAFFYVLNCLATWYYAFVVGLALLVYAFARAGRGPRPWGETCRERRLWQCGVAFVLTLALVLPAVIPMIRLSRQGQMRYSLPEADWLSVSPEDYVLPSAYHSLWGSLSLAWWDNWVPYYPWIVPGMACVGLVIPILAILTRGMKENATQRRALLVMAGIAAVLSLGLTLHVRGERVYVPVPALVEDAFTKLMIVLTKRLALNPVAAYAMPSGLGVYIPLPTMLLYLFLPFFNGMRDWRRFAVVPIFALSVLAGMGASKLLASRRGAARVLTSMVLLGLLLLELAAIPLPFGMSLTQPRPSDEWLAQQPGEFVVMQFPFRARAYAGPSLYGMMTHGKRVAYASGVTFFPLGYSARLETLYAFPSAESIALLKSWDVKYILVGATRYGDEWFAVEAGLNARADLKLVATFDEPSTYVAYRPGPMTGSSEDERWTADRVYIYEVEPWT